MPSLLLSTNGYNGTPAWWLCCITGAQVTILSRHTYVGACVVRDGVQHYHHSVHHNKQSMFSSKCGMEPCRLLFVLSQSEQTHPAAALHKLLREDHQPPHMW